MPPTVLCKRSRVGLSAKTQSGTSVSLGQIAVDASKTSSLPARIPVSGFVLVAKGLPMAGANMPMTEASFLFSPWLPAPYKRLPIAVKFSQ
jgi:hypothetical protein